eukprot:m.20686 g.20686  ORF g.20686 m.20686 type:complete len:128 (+) comp8187_c0_seq2:478-861(+)
MWWFLERKSKCAVDPSSRYHNTAHQAGEKQEHTSTKSIFFDTAGIGCPALCQAEGKACDNTAFLEVMHNPTADLLTEASTPLTEARGFNSLVPTSGRTTLLLVRMRISFATSPKLATITQPQHNHAM